MNFARLNIGIIGNKILSQGFGVIFIMYLKIHGLLEQISNYSIILTTITVTSLVTTLGKQNTILPLSKKLTLIEFKQYVLHLRLSSTINSMIFGIMLSGIIFFANYNEYQFNLPLMMFAIIMATNTSLNVELLRAKSKYILAEYFRMTQRVIVLLILYFSFGQMLGFINTVLMSIIVAGLLSFIVELFRFDLSYRSQEEGRDRTIRSNVYSLLWSLLFTFTPVIIIVLYRAIDMSDTSGNYAFYLRVSEVFGLVVMSLNSSLEPFIDESYSGVVLKKKKFNIQARKLMLLILAFTFPLVVLLPVIEFNEKFMLIAALAAKGIQLYFGPIIAVLRARMMYEKLFKGYSIIAISQCLLWATLQGISLDSVLGVISLPISVLVGFTYMYKAIDSDTRSKWSLATELF